MTDTKIPRTPETGCAPLNRPYAETVSLEVVWACAFVKSLTLCGASHRVQAVEDADAAVADLLAAHPRGAR
jgi:hypothetical protein